MTSKELNEILNKTRRTPNISLTVEQVEELIRDLERLECIETVLDNIANRLKLEVKNIFTIETEIFNRLEILEILKEAYYHAIWELYHYHKDKEYYLQDGSDGYREMEITKEQYDLIKQWIEEE